MIKNSIIVPAYNEEKRSAGFIVELINFVKQNVNHSEIIIVNDGSIDNTDEIIRTIIKKNHASSFMKIIGYSKNRGKGNAIAFGVMHAKGEKILFIDADGSIPPKEIPWMLDKLDSYDVVVGDRLSDKSKVKSNILRKLFSLGFNSIISLIFQYSYRDNLCGFKGFRKEAAKKLFSDLKDKRWIFDVELFYKIKKIKYSLYFLPIEWHHVGDSRINYLKDPFKWFFRVISLRWQLINHGKRQ